MKNELTNEILTKIYTNYQLVIATKLDIVINTFMVQGKNSICPI